MEDLMAEISVSHMGSSCSSKVHYDRASAGMDLRKVTAPLLTYLLRREMRFPSFFLIRCKLTVGRLKRSIDPKFPQELIDLAALPLWVYINLKKKIGQRQAFEIMRVAILTGGIAHWNFAYRAAEKERTFENLCDAEIEVNKTGPTRWNALEVVERSKRRFEIKITRCLYHELTTALGIPELTPVICQIDNAAFNSYLPDKVVFNRGGPNHRIADGKKECNFVWEVID
jgi:L-2-amino-thiazoline-4-carboxylic acid hydrolase-like protein